MVDNIHSIFAAAACQFSLDQFSAFNQLITDNWTLEKEDMKHKLISLLGLIGKNTKSNDLGSKVRVSSTTLLGDLIIRVSHVTL